MGTRPESPPRLGVVGLGIFPAYAGDWRNLRLYHYPQQSQGGSLEGALPTPGFKGDQNRKQKNQRQGKEAKDRSHLLEHIKRGLLKKNFFSYNPFGASHSLKIPLCP